MKPEIAADLASPCQARAEAGIFSGIFVLAKPIRPISRHAEADP
jgi:hypothetical protein